MRKEKKYIKTSPIANAMSNIKVFHIISYFFVALIFNAIVGNDTFQTLQMRSRKGCMGNGTGIKYKHFRKINGLGGRVLVKMDSPIA